MPFLDFQKKAHRFFQKVIDLQGFFASLHDVTVPFFGNVQSPYNPLQLKNGYEFGRKELHEDCRRK